MELHLQNGQSLWENPAVAPYFSTHAMQPPEKVFEPDAGVEHFNRFCLVFGPEGRVPQSALFVASRYLCQGIGWLKLFPDDRRQLIVTFSKVTWG